MDEVVVPYNTTENDIGIVDVARNASDVFATIQAVLTELVGESGQAILERRALTERVDVMQRELAAHVADLRLHEREPAPPPPEADAGDAFKAGDLVMIGPWRVIHDVDGFPGMAVDIQQDQRGHEIRIDGILRKNVHPYERAAAAPTPTRTISRDRLNELVDRWFSEPTDSFQNRMTDVLQELGHEVEP